MPWTIFYFFGLLAEKVLNINLNLCSLNNS
jgi:hypothetical protein